jgi:hypothetical protein
MMSAFLHAMKISESRAIQVRQESQNLAIQGSPGPLRAVFGNLSLAWSRQLDVIYLGVNSDRASCFAPRETE